MMEGEEIQEVIDTISNRYLADYPSEAVREIEAMTPDAVATLMLSLPVRSLMPIWRYLSPSMAAPILTLLPDQLISDILNYLDPAISARILSRYDDEVTQRLLSLVEKHLEHEISEHLSYPHDTAGTLMNADVVAFHSHITVAKAISILKAQKRHNLAQLFLLDDDGKLSGIVSMQRLALAEDEQTLKELSEPVKIAANAFDPKDEIFQSFEKYKINVLPVIDANGFLIGVINANSLYEVLKENIVGEMQSMVGVSKDERALSTSFTAVRKRQPWLQINLLTAFLAAAIVGLFEGTIAKYTALAVLLPIAAGQSGNAGAQALAVTMRGLTLREITLRSWLSITLKEMGAGLLNGIAVSITCALGIFIWSKSYGLALIMTIAMIISMTLASIAGGLVPLALKRFGLDPAQSSSIVLTTITDIVGFMSFLGIATMLSNLLSTT